MAASSQRSSPVVPLSQIPRFPYFRPSPEPLTFYRSHLQSRPVKITVSHQRSIEEVKQAIDRSLDDVFTGSSAIPVKLTQERRSWHGDTLVFSLVAKMGFMSTPISGTVLVTDQDVTIDANLGLLERLIPAAQAQQAVSSRIKALLK